MHTTISANDICKVKLKSYIAWKQAWRLQWYYNMKINNLRPYLVKGYSSLENKIFFLPCWCSHCIGQVSFSTPFLISALILSWSTFRGNGMVVLTLLTRSEYEKSDSKPVSLPSFLAGRVADTERVSFWICIWTLFLSKPGKSWL